MEMEIDGKVLRLETGEIGRLAAGAVIARMGNSVVYSTACGDLWEDKEETVEDFVPLSVHYQERSSAAGKTPGEVPLVEKCGCAMMRSGLLMHRAPQEVSSVQCNARSHSSLIRYLVCRRVHQEGWEALGRRSACIEDHRQDAETSFPCRLLPRGSDPLLGSVL
jgi:hypothetical protein